MKRGRHSCVATVLLMMAAATPRGASAAEDTTGLKLQTVTVFAAASLTTAFHAIATAYEQAHPDVRLQLDFGGSQTLVQQIEQGAPADVFASADEVNMQKLVASANI